MRPDEHKKKKNAAYKKKHNIQTVKQSGSSSREQDSSRSEHLSDNCQQTDSKSQTEEMASSEVFRRRKIESNWEKYEEPAGSETVTDTDICGADYGELVKATRNVKAQYQFASFDVPLASEEVAEFLSIDCQHLGRSVCCVPLHERLNIPAHLFDKSEIDAFRAAASDKLSQHEQTKAEAIVTPVPNICMMNTETTQSCQHVSDTSSSSSSAAIAAPPDVAVNVDCNVSAADKTLSQLDVELESLLSI